MIISYELWKRRFGGDPKIVGSSVGFGSTGKPRQVVGIMPPNFRFPIGDAQKDFWIPLEANADQPDFKGRNNQFMYAIGRMKKGVTMEQLGADLDLISRQLEPLYPRDNASLRFRAAPLHDRVVHDTRGALLLLFAAVAVVLLIGCANVANLLLARGAARQKEITIRAALGATRGRVIAQLLAESVLLALIAGTLGLLIAAWGVDALIAAAPPNIPRLEAVTVDRTVLLFSLGLSMLSGIVFGIGPAMAASKLDLTDALKEGTRGSTEGRRRNRIRNALVMTAVALSVVLLAGTGLLIRSFIRITNVDPGFNAEEAIALHISPRVDIYKEDPQVWTFYDRLFAALRAVPGVQHVAGSDALPLGGSESTYSFNIGGQAKFPVDEMPGAVTIAVTPGYFSTLGTRILKGRDVSPADTAKTPLVMLVNQAFERRFLNGNAIGRSIDLDDEKGPRLVVGVVEDVRYRSLSEEQPATCFMPARQWTVRYLGVVVRAKNAATLEPTLRAVVKQVDPRQAIVRIETLSTVRAASLAQRRFSLLLLAILAILALVLAAVGIYSIMSYNVAQRTSEIGIRMALGAEQRDILRLVVGHAVTLVGIGASIGLLIAFGATRIMRSLLYGIAPGDPGTFAAITALIAVVALIASWLPARRAATVDPLVAMRYD